ncbi:S9 family peptidase [Candidatus Bipolaricaulota bacterium]|nr:S9 family peptidase [Candidatus Bipolaricaulota bacterium]
MKPVQIEDLLDYRFLSSVEIAPSGDWAAFVVKSADAAKKGYDADIYLAPLAGGEVRRLTTSGKDGPFIWEAAGDVILFASKRKEDVKGTALYRIRITGGEAEFVVELPHKAEAFQLLPDGRILFTARVPLDEAPDQDDAGDYEVLEEIPFWQNSKGFTSRKRVRLFICDPATRETKTLSEPELEIQSFDCLENRLTYVARRFSGIAATTSELWLHDLISGDSQSLSRDELALSDARFLDHESLLVLASDMAQYGLSQNRELLLYNLPNRTSQSLTPGWDRSVGNSVASDCRHGGGPTLCVDQGFAYVTITERATSKVVRISRDGTMTVVADPNGSVDAFAVSHGRIVCAELHADALHELYIYDGGSSRKLTSLNENGLAEKTVSMPEPFSVKSGNTTLDAWIVKPTAFDPGTKYPTILTIHGGPRGAYGDVFFHEMQFFAAQGYVLIYTNPRGSSGRGNDFANLQGKYGTIDYDDLMSVVDAAIERFPFIDTDRLGVTGGSYGGFMTNWIIGHTNRFKAAVSLRSIANWTSKFNTTDIGYYFNKDAMGTDPWADGGADKLWWHSPLKYADKAVTPTLFIHSEQDYRCWLAEGLQMFTALRYHGVDSRLVMFREENHELSRSGKPKHRARRLQEMLNWFNRYLKSE